MIAMRMGFATPSAATVSKTTNKVRIFIGMAINVAAVVLAKLSGTLSPKFVEGVSVNRGSEFVNLLHRLLCNRTDCGVVVFQGRPVPSCA